MASEAAGADAVEDAGGVVADAADAVGRVWWVLDATKCF
jgi:hypothetical protein